MPDRIATQFNDILHGREKVPAWTTYGKILCQKDPDKENAVDNFKPISCLPLRWKLITGVL